MCSHFASAGLDKMVTINSRCSRQGQTRQLAMVIIVGNQSHTALTMITMSDRIFGDAEEVEYIADSHANNQAGDKDDRLIKIPLSVEPRGQLDVSAANCS